MSDDDLRDGFGAQITAALERRSHAEAPGVTAVAVHRRAHRWPSRRRVVGAALAVALIAGAVLILIGRDDKGGFVRTVPPAGRTTNETPGTPASTTTFTSTTVDLRPANLPVSDAIRAALADAFADGSNMPRDYVAGTVPGSVYYAYDPSTHTYWALADFSGSEKARRAHELLAGTPNDPYIKFQDGPLKFSRAGGAAWKLVGDTGGLICPPPPESVLAVWALGGNKDCP